MREQGDAVGAVIDGANKSTESLITMWKILDAERCAEGEITGEQSHINVTLRTHEMATSEVEI